MKLMEENLEILEKNDYLNGLEKLYREHNINIVYTFGCRRPFPFDTMRKRRSRWRVTWLIQWTL